jgi:arylsulfatase A-like enzyme
VLQKLDEYGIKDQTLILFTSDNGLFMGEHGIVHAKMAAYEASMRVPLLVRYPPWFAAGSVDSTNLALNTDLGDTILAYAGLPRLPDSVGQNLLTLSRDRFYYQYFYSNGIPCHKNQQAVRAGPGDLSAPGLKVVRFTGGEGGYDSPDLLFDTESDPEEATNLFTDPNHSWQRTYLESFLSQCFGAQ